MTGEPSPAVYLSAELADFLKKLQHGDKVVKWINDMIEVLKENKFAGNLIPRIKFHVITSSAIK